MQLYWRVLCTKCDSRSLKGDANFPANYGNAGLSFRESLVKRKTAVWLFGVFGVATVTYGLGVA
jgi:hypothetical protein